MRRGPVPTEIDAFLRRSNPAVIATLRTDGSPHTVATWYLWDTGRVLVSMDDSRRRLKYMGRNPRVALTVLDAEDWGRHVSIVGRVATITEDKDLSDIDRLAIHYTGRPFRTRDRRRFSCWISVEAWHAWDGSRPWVP